MFPPSFIEIDFAAFNTRRGPPPPTVHHGSTGIDLFPKIEHGKQGTGGGGGVKIRGRRVFPWKNVFSRPGPGLVDGRERL